MQTTVVWQKEWRPLHGRYKYLCPIRREWLVIWQLIAGKLCYVGPKAEYLDDKSIWGKKE
jgi:hypothetical protein